MVRSLSPRSHTILAGLADKRQAQANTDAGLQNTRAQIGVAYGHLNLANREFEEKKQDYKDTRQDKKDAQQEAEDAKIEQIKAAAAAKAAAKGKAPEGGILNANGDPATMKDGSLYTGIPKDMYKDIYGGEGSFKTGLDAIDQLRQMRRKRCTSPVWIAV